MAASTGARKTGGSSKKGTSAKAVAKKRAPAVKSGAAQEGRGLRKELALLLFFAVFLLLFLCNFGIIGPVGNFFSGLLFGLFGLLAYIAPVWIFLLAAFYLSNRGNWRAAFKVLAGTLLFFLLMAGLHLIQGDVSQTEGYSPLSFFLLGRDSKQGGGFFGGSLAWLLYSLLDTLGSALVILIGGALCLVSITGKSLIGGVKKGGRQVMASAREDARSRKERKRLRREEEARLKEEEERLQEEDALRREQEEEEKLLRMDRKVSGVMLDTRLAREPDPQERRRHDDIHEITLKDLESWPVAHREGRFCAEEAMGEAPEEEGLYSFRHAIEPDRKEDVREVWPEAGRTGGRKREEPPEGPSYRDKAGGAARPDFGAEALEKPYRFPPLSCLARPGKAKKGSAEKLTETAAKLQQTLANFGVRVTITDISQGPSVTRYEMQPEQGVKVSRIVSLTDDIKLNLAATDIRIEAPIPGKAAVGIEVPNRENSAVSLRDLLESKEYREFPSKLAFAVGKDIAGKTVVADIAKMPHMLIAGATGSGKSVCINTLIMSILYKAAPDEVKLIMIDPKVVELSVYNGIPHLLIPVVTDPKKAAGALHWGVAEMTDRYQKFADFNVRDMKGYNEELARRREQGEEDVSDNLPQIVIIVDELADLMMVAPGEVEESICRLAQLARAAGIHLIIATQRPSVDVITGLIKANMPSRVAFAVSSGVDSRTILDMHGAEKLLGKGDMLFYPQGYPKPARMQGAFVSDKEVSAVVDFLKNQTLGNVYDEGVEQKIVNIGGGGGSDRFGEEARDSYFEEAARFIIEKDKASIGMLQRMFKIGFNRAARIMDQLADAGVVGEEEGTKPRRILMSMEEFESYREEG